jgi:hypothetical protein
MMMKRMTRVALMMALAAGVVAPVQAAQTNTTDDRSETDIYVVNNHLADVRIFVEDANGKLHNLCRVARGEFRKIEVPADVAEHEYRIKVFPSTPVWSPIPDDYGIKTSLLNSERDHQVTMWLEADLTQSLVEIDRG